MFPESSRANVPLVLVASLGLAGLLLAVSAVGCMDGGGTTGSGVGGGGGGSGSGGVTGQSGVGGSGASAGMGGGAGGLGGASGSGPAGQGGSSVAGTGGVGGASGGSSGGGSGGGSGRGGSAGGGAGAVGTGGGGAGGSGRGGSSGGGSGGGGNGGSGGTGGSGARWTCPAGPFTNPTSATLTPTRITGVPPFDTFNNNGNNFGNIEGAVWMGDALYVSEIASGTNPPPSRILRIDGAGGVTIAIADAGSNGNAIDPMGRLVTANHKFGAITSFSLPGGVPTHIVQTYMGARFDSPNDLAIRSDGTIYFTDPDYQAPSSRPQTQTRVDRVAPGASTATVVDAARQQPNGITLSLDEMTLYVGGGDGIWRYALDAAGNAVGAGTRFAPSVSSSDGMTMDCAGNLYVTANGQLVVLSPAGTSIASVLQMGITNVAFGGADHRTLYVTALGNGRSGSAPGPQGLFRVAMPLPGMPY